MIASEAVTHSRVTDVIRNRILVNGAHQVRAARIFKLEAEVALGIRLGAILEGLRSTISSPAAGLLVVPFLTAPLRISAEAVVATKKKVKSAIAIRTIAASSQDPSRDKCRFGQDDIRGEFQTLAPSLLRSAEVAEEASRSSRAISARMAAASSSSENFSDWYSEPGSLPAFYSKFRSRRFS